MAKTCCSVRHRIPNGQEFRISGKGRKCMTRATAKKTAAGINDTKWGRATVECRAKMPPKGD
jgi:hypothetical protein